MSGIFRDSNIFICIFEDPGECSDQVVAILERMLERGDELITSALTVAEILVKPLRDRTTSRATAYENVI